MKVDNTTRNHTFLHAQANTCAPHFTGAPPTTRLPQTITTVTTTYPTATTHTHATVPHAGRVNDRTVRPYPQTFRLDSPPGWRKNHKVITNKKTREMHSQEHSPSHQSPRSRETRRARQQSWIAAHHHGCKPPQCAHSATTPCQDGQTGSS